MSAEIKNGMVRNLERGAAWIALGALLIGANLIGNLSAYLYAATLVFILPALLTDNAARQHMWRPESAAYLLAFLLLLVAFALSAQDLSDMQYIGNFIFFLMFIPAIATFSTVARPQASFLFAAFALAGAAVSLAVAIYEVRVLGIGRAVGFLNLTNPFAMASVMLGFLSLMGLFARKGVWRFLFLLGPVFAAGATTLAGTRNAMVMMAFLVVLSAGFWAAMLQGRHRFYFLAACAALGATLVALVALLSGQVRALSAFQALATFANQGQAIDFSTEIRLNLYYGGLRAFLESPIYGHGWWHHVEAARPYMSELVQQNTVRWSHLHNDYVNFSALAGILGLGAYLLYMAIPVAGAIKSVRDNQYVPRLFGACVIASCYAVFGLFDTSFSMELLLGFGPVCTAALLGFCVDQPWPSRL
ncbi:O-antigen ligase family protein [Devosia sp. YIM 151766]|uniref:O-antigen ligase family protein n=1 Tax=Devosia sp. YIM 151766 TaxID=3017325 RepID=UPI00255CBC58|nr:O-antigen ligase family protein [Devosia sp. YIM 151766]WIY52912.1 O-antigen ligase family protein [Devosia sp. YIM 151766]